MPFFTSKAETLQQLKPLLKHAQIAALAVFSVREWHHNGVLVIQKISTQFKKQRLAVRSSARSEDNMHASQAGHFTSVLDVPADNPTQLKKAISAVISSYDDAGSDNLFFIQPYLDKVTLSGVAFTRDKDTFAPYTTINYDDISGKTDVITSGRGLGHKSLVVYNNKPVRIRHPILKKIYASLGELITLTQCDSLDVEFCYYRGTVFILQVRPIAHSQAINTADEKQVSEALEQIHGKIIELSRPHPHLYGKQTAYGNMPDWNPAEMIGVKPRPLALSLYKELITDSIWAYQRDNYGYKNLRSFPLMVSFAGQPYIDVRVDFNSWIPKSLSDRLSAKLADYYLQRLIASPSSHDKIEFEIVYSCYTFDLATRLQELRKAGFTGQELSAIRTALLALTNSIVKPNGLYVKDFEKIQELEQRRKDILKTKLSPISKIFWLIEDCKRYGTLPFAGLARAAFIATQFLNSLVALGVISQDERTAFFGSLHTVTRELNNDIALLSRKKLSSTAFLQKYGHLRPGTYDILSESYGENPKKYFNFASLYSLPREAKETSTFSFSKKQLRNIEVLLKSHGIQAYTRDFIEFLRRAIEGREYSKFIFTKNINEILKYARIYGENQGLSGDDMSFIDIRTLQKLYSTIAFANEKNALRHEIEHSKQMYATYQTIHLPHLICSADDIYCFSPSSVEPNYITLKKVEAPVINVTHKLRDPDSIRNKIVFIESADPGFDWIFSHGITGLITMYGGVNSHMSVRSAELNIPAVIGCGTSNFKEWKHAVRLHIDCLNKRVIILA